MQIPANAAAETVARLRSVNNDIETQVSELRGAQERNEETIAALEPVAEWSEIPDPIEEEPEGVEP